MGRYAVDFSPDDPNESHSLMLQLTGQRKRVLDVGCAEGDLARALRRQGCSVSGIEGDAAAAALAEEVLDSVVVADLDADDLDLVNHFGAETFDVVICGDVLEHLRQPARLLGEVRKVLRRDGSLVTSLPNVAHGDLRLSLLAGRWQYRPTGLLDDTHLRFYTRESMLNLLETNGFSMVDLRWTTAPLFGTELGVHVEEFPPAVVEAVRAAPDAEVYQFVGRSVRDDARPETASRPGRVRRGARRLLTAGRSQ